MLVQDVINSVSNDIRQVLASSGTDANIFIPWVDRIQKDCLHTSLFNYLIQNVETMSVTVDTSIYTLSNPVRRILLVYDRTFDRILLPMDNVGLPTTKSDATTGQPTSMPMAMLSATTMDQWPEYYRRIGASTVYLFPAPQKPTYNGTYEVHYESMAPDLENLTDTLLIPDDGEDLVVAGVNMLATQYLKLSEETPVWKAYYEQMKKGILD
jgi:hypothetical protein